MSNSISYYKKLTKQGAKGGTRMLTIPKELCINLEWEPGDLIEISILGKNELKIKKVENNKECRMQFLNSEGKCITDCDQYDCKYWKDHGGLL